MKSRFAVVQPPETLFEAFENVAGLLTRMGYFALVDPQFQLTQGRNPAAGPAPAVVTDAPEIVVGLAVGLVAEDPEAALPNRSARYRRVGDAGGLYAFWRDLDEDPRTRTTTEHTGFSAR